MNALTIKKEIEINAPIEDVFSSLTNSKEIVKYFPLNSVESEWVDGAEVLYKGEVNGVPFTDYGVIEEISPPTVYRYRYWSDNHGTDKTDNNHLLLEYVLSTSRKGTTLNVTQSNIRSKELYEMMESQVWDYLLGSFKEHMEGRT